MSFWMMWKKQSRSTLTPRRNHRYKDSFNYPSLSSGPGSGSIIPEADSQIRIHIKMKRIQKTAFNYPSLECSYWRLLSLKCSNRRLLSLKCSYWRLLSLKCSNWRLLSFKCSNWRLLSLKCSNLRLLSLNPQRTGVFYKRKGRGGAPPDYLGS